MLIGVIAEESLIPSAVVASFIVREAASAADVPNAGFVLPNLVDDPASVTDIIDAYLGEIMSEAASAADVPNASIPATYAVAVAEAATAADSCDFVSAPFAIDGIATHVTGGSGTTIGLTLPTTTYGNDVLVLFSAQNGAGAIISSVTDSSGKTATWQLRKSITSGFNIEEWYTTTTGPISGSPSVTVNYGGSPSFKSVSIFAISGANISSPFDTNVSVPSFSSSSPADPLSCNTTAATTIAIAGYRMSSTASPTAGSGWTQDSGADFLLVEHKFNTSPQTGLSATIGTGVTNSNGGILDAIKT